MIDIQFNNCSIIYFSMSHRGQNFGGSYYENNAKLGYSAVSRNYGYGTGYANGNLNKNYGMSQDENNYGEVEFMLQNERKKFKEAREKFEEDLDHQRKSRIQCQNKLIKIKDQFSKKEIHMSQLEFKLNNILHQNQDLFIENDKLKNELIRLEDIYGGKIQELQTQLSMQTRNFQQTTIQYNSEFEKFKKQGQDYVQQLTFEMERKIKSLEEKLKATENGKKDLCIENKKLNEILISNKLVFEEEIRDVKNRAREEEIKKSQLMNKSHQQKIKVIEESKQIILRKNQELLRAIQEKDRQIQEIQSEQNDQIGKYRQDNSDLHQQINHMTYIVNKLKAEISEKDSYVGRSNSENDNENLSLKQQLQNKKQQIAVLSSTVRDIRQTLKEAQTDWERKRRELNDRCSMFQNQSRKYKQEYLRICDMLKAKINQTINHVSYKK